ncbi:MAG: HD domain-containing protein [Clostridia bacterium]|nr:HD domain-containing protein [Clostridia bacterium]
MMKVPEEVLTILGQLNTAGHSAYVVGGCVRDSLLGLIPGDWDICTSASPEQMKECFSNYHVIETGLKHGTLTVRVNHQSYEITTFRTDGNYTDCRHPEKVTFVSDIKDDLARRDFTVNAMAYHPDKGLMDLFGGLNDLSDKKLRCVGDSKTRFTEDALRIMRGLRFAATYGFSIATETEKAMFQTKELLLKIAPERIIVELKKLLLGEYAENILLSYRKIFGEIVPELVPMFDFDQKNPHHLHDVWTHTVKSVVVSKKDIMIRLAVLFHDIGKPKTFLIDENGIGHFHAHALRSADITQTILKRLKLDNYTVDTVTELVKYHDAQIEATEKSVKRWLNKIGPEQLERLLFVKEADAKSTVYAEEKLKIIREIRSIFSKVMEENACFALKDLEISGSDLILLGIPEGKLIGDVLKKLLSLVIDGEIPNQKEILLSVAQKEYKNIR